MRGSPPPLGAMAGPRLQPASSLDVLLPAPSATSRFQAALAVVPGALGSISFSRTKETLKKLFFITLAAAALILAGHAAWRSGAQRVVASVVVCGGCNG